MTKNKRLISLDVFRGLTIAGMILVNDPGSWQTVYAPLLHAEWHGCTPTDLVFPFFVFIVGISITFSLKGQLQKGKTKPQIIQKVLIRGLIIFGLGLFLSAFPFFGGRDRPPSQQTIFLVLLSLLMVSVVIKEIVKQENALLKFDSKARKIWTYIPLALLLGAIIAGWGYFDFSHQRIPGVLQRIALCFIFSALIFLFTNWRQQIAILAILLVGYWALMTLVPVPGIGPANLEPETNLGAWLDRVVIGSNHLYSQTKVWDPEGLLSTIPAIGNGIMGLLVGAILQSRQKGSEITSVLFVFGSIAIFLGLFWDLVFPINKKIWTSSYVLYTAGIGTTILAILYWLIDVKAYKKNLSFLLAYGMNAITAYALSSILAKTLIYSKTSSGDSFWSWTYDHLFLSWLGPYNASLLFAICFVIVVWLPIYWLYKQRIIIKV